MFEAGSWIALLNAIGLVTDPPPPSAFPKLSLTGDVGSESVSVGQWFEPGYFWSIGPSLQWRVLGFGRVRAEVRAQLEASENASGSRGP